MILKIDDLQWDELPAEVKAHLIDLNLKQQAREAAAEAARATQPGPRDQKVIYHPYGPKPLTQPDGSVSIKHPQYAEYEHDYEAHCRAQRAKEVKGAVR